MKQYLIHPLQKRGSHHCFCQDYYVTAHHEDRMILVVSDGHGAATYTRSGWGANFACNAMVEVLQSEIAHADVPAAVKDRYDALVAEHMAEHPLADWEVERVGNDPHCAVYGATLLAACITPNGTDLYQLGDGEIHAVDESGSFLPDLPEDELCRGNLTTSIAHNREFALKHFRTMHYDAPVTAIMLMSDGCDGGFLRTANALSDTAQLENNLRAMLRATNRGDDQTVLLAYDPGAVNTEAFRHGLTDAILEAQKEARRARKAMRELEEFERLRSYLKLAYRNIKRMGKQNDPRLQEYLDSLAPSYERYMQLLKSIRNNH